MASHRVAAGALVTLRIALAAGASALVFLAGDRHLFLYWLGAVAFLVSSVPDISAASGSTLGSPGAFGALLDSVGDQVGETLVLAAVALVFVRRRNELAVGFTAAGLVGLLLVRYAWAWAELVGVKVDVGPSGRQWAAFIAAGLAVAPWGGLRWAIFLLAATACALVLRCALEVRRQLRSPSRSELPAPRGLRR